MSMAPQDKNESHAKLSRLPAGSPLGTDISHLDTINKLREFREKGQSAVVFDDQVILIPTLFSKTYVPNI